MEYNQFRPAITPVEKAAGATGAIFLLVGILGFIPGITTHYDALNWAGRESGAALLGIFQVSVLHNLIHLLFGVAGLVMARHANPARAFLIVGGVIYALMLVYGLLIDRASSANLVPVNTADNWLHLVLAAGMIVLGVALGEREAGATTAGRRSGLPRAAH